jgi:hypothetical protein
MKVTMLKMLKTFRISTTKMTTDLSSSNECGQSTTRVIRILRITGIATARITGAVRIDELTVQRNRTCPLQEQLSMVITSRTVFRGTEDDQQDQRRLLSIARKRWCKATDQVCIDDVTLTPTEVWCVIRDRFYGSDSEIVQGATKKQVLGRLYRTRTNLFGRESFGRLEREPLCDVKDSCGLKFFSSMSPTTTTKSSTGSLVGAHPQLLDRMKQRRSSIFVDATYRCVPVQFYQLVIVMLYDPISDLYLPVWYILTTGKTAQVYDHVFNNLFIASKRKLDPAHIVCDFEFAMIKSVQAEFPDSHIVGCLFHFKQALRRKMLKLKISEPEVNLAMREGCIDRLTTMRRLDINLRGIHEVRSTIKRDCSSRGISYARENWKKFWKYFKKTWLHKFEPAWWNINGVREDIVNRTNNPLERYNRTLNTHFNGGHPDVTRFISVIEQESRENLRLLTDISNRRASAPNHAPAQRAPAFDSDANLEVDSDSNLEIVGANSDDSDSNDGSIRLMSPEY